MKKFITIQKMAEKRKGGAPMLKKLLPKELSKRQLMQKGDDRFLAMMTKAINQAGFNWSVIAKKWPQFEEAFYQFDVERLAHLSPEQWEAYMQDKRVVRNWQKISALMHNVLFVRQESQQHGSFGKFIANWPADDQIGLMAYLRKNGSRLGGQTAQWFMRYIGKDVFILTGDVISALQNAGIDIANNPTSKRDLQKIQNTMNTWQQETGLSYSHLSRIAAYSIGKNYSVENIQAEMKKFSS